MSAFYVLGPVVAARELGGATAWGVIMVAGAIGSVVAGGLSLRARPQRPLVPANLALALAGLPLLALAVPLPTGVVALCTAAAFGGLAYMSTLWETAVQRHIPPQAMSRVFAWDWLASLVVAPVGRAVVGPLAVAVGTGTTLAGAGILLVASSLGVIAVPSVRGLRAGEGNPVFVDS